MLDRDKYLNTNIYTYMLIVDRKGVEKKKIYKS